MKYKWYYYGLTLLLWLGYIALTFDPGQYTVAADKYHISTVTVMLLVASIQLPVLAIWLFAVAGWSRLRYYVNKLPDTSADRDGYKLVLMGLAVLVLGVVVPSLFGALYAKFISVHRDAVLTIISNYLSLLGPLIGLILAAIGSSRLLESAKIKPQSWLKSVTVIVPMVVFASFYVAMVFTNPVRQSSTDPAVAATYFLPDYAIVLTIVMPVIVTWAFGFRMALNFEHYSHYVRLQHKPAIVNIYNGALVITGATILQQVLVSIGSSRLSGLNLVLLLSIIYLLLLVMGAGYALIARGAKQLAATVPPSTTKE